MNGSDLPIPARPTTVRAAPNLEADLPSRLGQYCGGLIEASWLAGVVLTPLFMNRLSSRMFDGDKMVLLRCLALVMAAAWLVRLWEATLSKGVQGRERLVGLMREPLVVAVAALGVAYLIATIFSANAYESFWGSADRRQGTYTFLSYLILSGGVASYLRSREQLDRLITAVILASLPVAVYALIQRAGIDPVLYAESQSTRPFATAGNPISLAAYLLMVLPLTCWRIHRDYRAPRCSSWEGGFVALRLSLGVVIALTQLAAMGVTQSRGPLVGLLAALGMGTVLCSALSHRWRWRRPALILGGVAMSFYILLNTPQGPLQSWRSRPVVERFASMLSPHRGSSERAVFWQEAPKLILAQTPLTYPDGHIDQWHGLRPWFGYGPETLDGVMAHQYSLPEAAPARLNVFHNLVWDLWESIGAFGLAAALALFVLTFYYSYRRLGLLRTDGATADVSGSGKRLFWFASGSFALAGAVGFSIWQGLGFAGLGLQLGLTTGLMVYPIFRSRSGSCHGLPTPATDAETGLLIALLAAVAGHWVETGFGFEVPASAMLYWVYIGVIVVLTRRTICTENSDHELATVGWRENQLALAAAMMSVWMALPLIFAFMSLYTRQVIAPVELLWQSLTSTPSGRSFWPLSLLLLAWIVPSLPFYGDGRRAPGLGSWTRQWLLALAISGTITGGYALWKAQHFCEIGTKLKPGASGMEVLQQCGEYQSHYLVFLLVIGGAWLAGGFAFSQGLKNHAGATDRRGWLAILIFFPAALASCYLLNVRSVYADIAFDRATALQAQGVRPGSLYAYELAVMLDPRIIDYRASVARLLRYYGETIADNDRSRELMRQAEQGLQEMQKYSLLNRAAYYLGELYLSWGMRENDSGMRTALGEKARAAFKQAIAYEPHSEFVWRQSANVERFLMHNQPEADRQDQIALAIGQNQDARNNGRFYTALSQEAVNGQLKQHYARRALEYYELGITDHAKKAAANELAPGSSPMDLHLGKGNVLLVLNELEAAQRCYRDATNAPGFKDVHQWQAELLLANIYYAATNQPAALAQALLAYNQAPRTVKPRLLEFVDRCRRLSTRSGRCQGE